MNGAEHKQRAGQPVGKPHQEPIDVLLSCMERLERSKTGPLLNLFYSFIVGLLSSCLARRVTKAHGVLGVVVGLASFVYNRRVTRSMLKH